MSDKFSLAPAPLAPLAPPQLPRGWRNASGEACLIAPPADCGSYGTVVGCTCNCQAGFANDLTVRKPGPTYMALHLKCMHTNAQNPSARLYGTRRTCSHHAGVWLSLRDPRTGDPTSHQARLGVRLRLHLCRVACQAQAATAAPAAARAS